jgi:hypothetical protein
MSETKEPYIRSNHDISFIASTSRMLASLDYMSNYATKDDVKLHQLVMTAAILKASLETTTRHASFRLCHVTNFARSERYEGAVMISSYLVGNPAFYMPNEKYRNLPRLVLRSGTSLGRRLAVNQSINQSKDP